MRLKVKLVAAQVAITVLVYALPILLPAGIRAWPAAWIFLALWFGSWVFVLVWLFRQDPTYSGNECAFKRPTRHGSDRIIYPLLHVSMFLWLLFTAYDAAGFHWSPVPTWLQALGAIILICSLLLYFVTFRENTFLSALVRVQQERDQKVISTGPYHYVRHPMYASTLIFVMSYPASTWGLAWNPCSTSCYDCLGMARGAGRAPAPKRIAWVLRIHETGEISAHSLCLVVEMSTAPERMHLTPGIPRRSGDCLSHDCGAEMHVNRTRS